MLQHVLDEAVASRLDEIVLVLGNQADEIRAALALPEGSRVRAVVNTDWARGQSTSLRLALRRASPSATAAAILLGDQPGVGAALIDRVTSAFLDAGLPAARPVYSGADGSRVPGHPVFLARRIWSEVDKLAGDEGARALLAARDIPSASVEAIPSGTADLVVEATGSPEGFNLALKALRPRGTLVLKSTYQGTAEVDLSSLVVDEITVVGSRCGPFDPALALLADRKVDPTPLIARRFRLEEGLEAFDRAGRPGGLKVLLQP